MTEATFSELVIEGSYIITDDPQAVQEEAVYAVIPTLWWRKGVSREWLRSALSNSYCISILHGNVQIGFARIVTDFTDFAW